VAVIEWGIAVMGEAVFEVFPGLVDPFGLDAQCFAALFHDPAPASGRGRAGEDVSDLAETRLS
jgi:hypothetical protein